MGSSLVTWPKDGLMLGGQGSGGFTQECQALLGGVRVEKTLAQRCVANEVHVM